MADRFTVTVYVVHATKGVNPRIVGFPLSSVHVVIVARLHHQHNMLEYFMIYVMQSSSIAVST